MQRFFISDLHLSDKRPDLIRAFVLLMESVKQQAPCELYILGDFYEAWIGDDYQPEWNIAIVEALASLRAQDVQLYVMHGNRDFLLGYDWATTAGATLMDEQSVLTHEKANILLLHGDECCLEDKEYQEFRRMVRSEQWQQGVLQLPLTQRITFAEKLRNDSKTMAQTKTHEIMDVTEAEIARLAKEYACKTLIHGHTHRPNSHQTSSYQRLVLGDWDQYIWLAVMENHLLRQYRTPVSQALSRNSVPIDAMEQVHQITV